ncbi:MAG: PAS domain S-box protein [Limisphaerales bacterium]
MRFGVRMTAGVTLALSGLTVWSSVRGAGSFDIAGLNESLLLLQLFISVSTVTALMLTAAVSQHREAVQFLRESEERHRILFESNPNPVWVFDLETLAFLAVNEAAVRKYGYSREEFLSMTIADIRPPEDIPAVRDFVTKIGPGVMEAGVWRHRLKDGRVIYVQSILQFLVFEGRRASFALVTDVTERKRTEEELQASEQRFRALIENSSDAIALVSPDGAIKYASPSTERILGYSPAEFVGRNAFEFIHPDDLPQTKRHLVELLNKPELLARVEYRIQHKDGHWLWMEGVGSNLLSEPAVGVIVINFRDITERKRADEKFRTAVESSSSGIVMVSQDGKIVLANSHMESLFGYPKGELAGKPIEILVPERYRSDHPTHRSGFFANPQGRAMGVGRDLFGLHKDGREIPVEIGLNPLRTEEGLFVLATIVDITERKRLEKELRDANEKLSGWVQELERRNREVFVLNEMGDLLQTCSNYDEAYRVIAQTATKLFPEESGAVFKFDPQARFLETAAFWGEPLLGEQSFGAERCWALRRGKMHLVENSQSELVCPHLSHPFWKGCLCVPLVAQSETVGLLHLQGGPERRREEDSGPYWTEAKIQLVRMAAEHMALNLSGLKLRSTLSERSIRDPLTGLFNRRYLEESLERELFRAARERKTLGAIMLDLDRFKEFNDTFGHPAGDQVLKAIGEFIQLQTRRGDIACRYGGEEFTMILPGASLPVTRERAEKLRQEIQQMKVPYSKHITVSLGVAVFPAHGTTKELLLKAADFALYQAKSEGGNRVAVAQSAPAVRTKVR